VSRIDALKKDAMVAIAGLAANRHEYPDLPVYGLFEKNDGDMTNAQSAIYRMVSLQNGFSVSDDPITVQIDGALMDQMVRIYIELEHSPVMMKHILRERGSWRIRWV
jgi:hypothetical protein